AARLRNVVADIPDPDIVIIGMAYKAETDDTRESPSVRIAELLVKDGYRVRQYDPLVAGHGYQSLADVAEGADLLAILVPHRVAVEELHRKETPIKAVMRTPRIVVF